MSKLRVMRQKLASLSDADRDPAKEAREPIRFQIGPAGITGETYYTVAVMRGRGASMTRDPQTGQVPVYTKRKIAEEVVARLEDLRMHKGLFEDVDCFRVALCGVGKESKILRPDVGSIVLPSLGDIKAVNRSK